jgi:hypothetical protein
MEHYTNADLFFVTSQCFICFHTLHRSESCPQWSLVTLFCKHLDDPHRESFVFSFCPLADDCVQGGMLTVLGWLRLVNERLRGRRRSKISSSDGQRPLQEVRLVGIFRRTILVIKHGLHQMRSCLQLSCYESRLAECGGRRRGFY